MNLYGVLNVLTIWVSFVYAQQPITDCKKTYVLDSEPGLYCTFYPINITGPVPGFGDSNLKTIVSWQYYVGNAVAEGGTTDLNFDIPIDTSLPDDIVEGFIYDLPITISNFTFEGMGWLRPQKTGWHTFNIAADTAAQLYIDNDTRTYCVQNSVNDMNIQFTVTSIPGQPSQENPTDSVYLYAGIPYQVQLSYLHMQGSPSLDITMTDPDGDFHPDISYLIQQFNLYAPGNQVDYYDLVNVTTTVGWSGNSTTFLGYSSTGTGDLNELGDFTATTYFIYGTPTPHITFTSESSSSSSSSLMVSTSEVPSSLSIDLYTATNSSVSTLSENASVSTVNVTETLSSVYVAINSTAILMESITSSSTIITTLSSLNVSSSLESNLENLSSALEPSTASPNISSINSLKQSLTSYDYEKPTVRVDYGNSSVIRSSVHIETSSGLNEGSKATTKSSSLVQSKESNVAEISFTDNQFSTLYYTTTIVITDVVTTVCPETIIVGPGSSISTGHSTSTYTTTETITSEVIECEKCTDANKSGVSIAEQGNNGSNNSGYNSNLPVVSGNEQPQITTAQNGNANNGVNAESKSTMSLSSVVNSGNVGHTGGSFLPQVVTGKSGNPAHSTAAIQVNANHGSKFTSVHMMSLFTVCVSFVFFM